MPQRAKERERHAAADQEPVDALQQVLDEGELVGDLGAAEHRHQRSFGPVEDPGEGLQLSPHQEPGRGRLQVPGDRLDRGVGAMGGGEGVVDVAVGQRGQRVSERVVVRLFLLVKT